MCKVSVIIPTYNREKTIKRAIRSVLNQTLQDFEIIVVDDCSRDHTLEVVKKLQKEDKRIKLIALDKNSGGPAKPRTIGVQNSTGEYIAFLDSDDIYMPENLRRKSKILDENPKIEIVDGWSWVVDEETKKIVDCWCYSPVNWLLRKRLFEEVKYFKEEQNGCDEIGWLLRYRKLRALSNNIFILEEPLTIYFRHKSQLSGLRNKNPLICGRRWETLLEDTNDSLSQAVISSRVGNFYCLAGDLKKGREYFLKSLNLHFNFLSLIFYLLSFLGKKGYEITEETLRFLYNTLLWKKRKIKARIQWKESYKEAINLIKNL